MKHDLLQRHVYFSKPIIKPSLEFTASKIEQQALNVNGNECNEII